MEHGETEKGELVIYTEKDGKGERTANGYPNIIKDKETYEEKQKALEEEYKKHIDEQKQKAQDFNKTLTNEVMPEITFSKIPFASLPVMDYDDLRTLLPMIQQ